MIINKWMIYYSSKFRIFFNVFRAYDKIYMQKALQASHVRCFYPCTVDRFGFGKEHLHKIISSRNKQVSSKENMRLCLV